MTSYRALDEESRVTGASGSLAWTRSLVAPLAHLSRVLVLFFFFLAFFSFFNA
jgi:hypothetical protein